MLVYRTWTKTESAFGVIASQKTYRILFLLGFIPLFIWIDG